MPRIPEIDEGNATPEQRALLEGDVAGYGSVLNTTRIWAHVPSLLPPIQAFHGALAAAGHVEPALVSLARLRTAQINGCPF